MTEQVTTIRLSKAAKEFNVATNTIVDYLEQKGISIANNPNTKIPDDAYEILLAKFQPDKLEKKKSEEIKLTPNIAKQIKTKSEPVAKQPETPAQVVDDSKSKIGLNVLGKLTVEELDKKNQLKPNKSKKVENTESNEQPKEFKEPEVEKQEPVEEVETKTPTVEAPAEVIIPEVKESREEIKVEAPAPVDEPKQEQIGGLKIKGTLDLDSTKPKKSKTPDKNKEIEVKEPEKVLDEVNTEAKAEIEEKTEIVETTGKVDIVETEVEAVKEETPISEPADIEVTSPPKETTSDDKQGLTIVGTLDLTQFNRPKKKQPVASSEEAKKRKRKRIVSTSSDNTQNKPATDNRGQGQGQGQNRNNQGQGQGQGQNRPPQTQQGQNRPQGANTDRKRPDQQQVQAGINRTFNRMNQGGSGQGQRRRQNKKQRKQDRRFRREQEDNEEVSNILKLTEFITANELAKMMDIPVTEIITACFSLGLMISINQRLDAETIVIVAEEFGFEVDFQNATEEQTEALEEPDSESNLIERAPIVTIMGHVDHGKTSLLDFIRNENVVAGEAGGITQHIGAYEVTLKNQKKVTFLDTPGHEAFTAMRARGAKVTDIVIIVVAADDSVMPQTKEAISHALAANVPIVFAINKIDKEGANVNKVYEELSAMNILVEEWGGKYQSQPISAKKGIGIDDLLEKVLLEAEILELKADPKKRAVGTVIEASLDKGRGIVATLLVEKGTLKVGDPIIAGSSYCKVRAMFNERGAKVIKAGPGAPVSVLGFDGAPTSGDRFYVTESDNEAKEIATKRKQLVREQGIRTKKHITLDEIGRRLAIDNFQELNVIVKADFDGSAEALTDSLERLSTEEIQVRVIMKGVGQISESDVLLASASDAIIVGFQVRPSPQARKIAEAEQIDIRLYSVIYDAIEELKSAMEGMLAPTHEERITATIEVREVFKITKVGTVAGCYVTDGKVFRNNSIRLIREGIVIHTGEIDALKRFKDDVKEVNFGYECGVSIKNYNDIKEGDIIESFERIEVARKLS